MQPSHDRMTSPLRSLDSTFCTGPVPLRVIVDWTGAVYGAYLDELECLFFEGKTSQAELDRRLAFVRTSFDEAADRLDGL